MFIIKRTNSLNKDFQILVLQLDALLDERDKEAHTVCDQYNHIETIKHAIVIYDGEKPIGCGAIRLYTTNIMEIKRMFVVDGYRRKGVASAVLQELETWSKDLGIKACILETGEKLPEAIKLYERNNYKRISNYGQYENMDSSICYKKDLV